MSQKGLVSGFGKKPLQLKIAGLSVFQLLSGSAIEKPQH
jgi:hypothetical protein